MLLGFSRDSSVYLKSPKWNRTTRINFLGKFCKTYFFFNRKLIGNFMLIRSTPESVILSTLTSHIFKTTTPKPPSEKIMLDNVTLINNAIESEVKDIFHSKSKFL